MGFLYRTDIKSAESAISKNINHVVEKTKEALNTKIETIFLSGGLSRNQGSAFLDKKTKKTILLGDYDLVCITKKKLPFFEKPGLPRGDLKFQNANAPVYVGIVPKVNLRSLKPSIEYIDWKNSANILYGNQKIFDSLNLDGDIPIPHAIEILFNRFRYLTENIGSFQTNPIIFGHALSKTILGIGDVKLILGKSYKTYIAEKLWEFDNLGTDTSFMAVYKQALRLKKYPERTNKLNLLFEKTKNEFIKTMGELNDGVGYEHETDNLKILDNLNAQTHKAGLLNRLSDFRKCGARSWFACLINPGLKSILNRASALLILSVDLEKELSVNQLEYVDRAANLLVGSGIIQSNQLKNKSKEARWFCLRERVAKLSSFF